MIAAIHQPDYIPYPGYFYKIKKSDVFLFLDDAQFSNNGGHDWNLIKTPRGAQRMKVPVLQTLGDPINKVKTKDDLGWKKQHLQAVLANYQNAPYFQTIYPMIQELLTASFENIAEMNAAIIIRLAHEFGLNPVFLKTSELNITTKREQRIIDLCHAVQAETYFSGSGARVYQSEATFLANKIKLVYSDYHPAPYPQLWEGFIENLSVIDYVMNCGFDLSLGNGV